MKKLAALAALLVLGALLLAGCGGSEEGSAVVPDCHPRHEKCKETSDGYVIPFWYWLILFNTQGFNSGNTYITRGALPSVTEEEAQGAPEGRIEESETEESENEDAVPEEEQAEPESSEEFEEDFEPEESESEGGDEFDDPSESEDEGGDDFGGGESFGGDDESYRLPASPAGVIFRVRIPA